MTEVKEKGRCNQGTTKSYSKHLKHPQSKKKHQNCQLEAIFLHTAHIKDDDVTLP